MSESGEPLCELSPFCECVPAVRLVFKDIPRHVHALRAGLPSPKVGCPPSGVNSKEASVTDYLGKAISACEAGIDKNRQVYARNNSVQRI